MSLHEPMREDEEDEEDEEVEEMLADLLYGRRAETDPDVVRAFAADPALRARYDELTALARQLDAAGARERESLEELLSRAPDPGDLAAARAFLEAHSPAARRARWRGPWWLVAAAAVLLAAWLAIRPFGGGAPPQPIVLGEHVEWMRPSGPIDQLERFEWQPRAPLEPGGFYEVEVLDRAGSPLAARTDIVATSWEPDLEQVRAMRAAGELRWVLTCRDASGRLIWSESAAFSLR